MARKYWENSLSEYYNVDVSPDMNEIARQMLTGGNTDPNAELPIKTVYYRQFLPARADVIYSFSVSIIFRLKILVLALIPKRTVFVTEEIQSGG